MSKVNKVSPGGKIRAVVIVWIVLFSATISFIIYNDLDDNYHVEWLESGFLLIRNVFLLDIYHSFNHFIIAFVINAILYISVGLIVGFAFYILMNIYFFRSSLSKKVRVDKYRVLHKGCDINYTPVMSDSRIMVVPSEKTNMEPIPDIDPICESLFNLKSTENNRVKATTPYEKLEYEILAILKSYPEVPASISGYHGQTGLLSHTLSVTKKLLEIADKKNIEDPLLRVIGLSHDIEKILAYKKKDGVWSLGGATHYHQVGVAFLRTLPSYKLLHEGDRKTFCRVLRFVHSPEKLPLGSTDRHKKLIEILKKADQAQTKLERSKSPANMAEVASDTEILRNEIISIIPDLNINESIRTGRADGWTMNALPYVVVVEENIRALLKEKGDPNLLSFLNLNIPFSQEGSHPATKAISETLVSEGLALLECGNIESKTGLFDLKNGSILFKGSFLLPKDIIKKHHPDIIERWGSSKYRITVLGAHKSGERLN
jgi:hypothetical protein